MEKGIKYSAIPRTVVNTKINPWDTRKTKPSVDADMNEN